METSIINALHTRAIKVAISGVLALSILMGAIAPAVAVSPAELISGSTTAAENDKGKWFFNRDGSTATPYIFDQQKKVLGNGALHILPIGANPSDKFIGEYFVQEPMADVQLISYDYQIGSGGDASDANEFYMNVYANFGESDPLKFYDCRYNIVPTVGSTSAFTTVSFDPTVAYPVTTRGGASASPYACPAIPADMNALSSGSSIRVIALNVGDTSTNDTGLDGYYDNVIVQTTAGTRTFDFDPYPVSGQITAPAEGEVVRYSAELAATYDDGDVVNDDAVQWAVRSNDCTTNVAGNVGGFNTAYNWDGKDFSSSVDVSALADGEYCFVFNPTDDPGQNNVREISNFIVNNVPAPEECTGVYTNVVVANQSKKSVRATSANDLILVRGDNIKVRAEDGDDCIEIRGNDNKIRAGNGDDSVVVKRGADNDIRGDDGNDIVIANNESTVRGGDGDDDITVGRNSKVYGDKGNDVLTARAGSRVDGGTETDTCFANPNQSTVKKCESVIF